MKIVFLVCFTLVSGYVLAQTRPDPNLKMTASKSSVVAPGCTEFVHPCSGQASRALLNAATLPLTNKIAAPINVPTTQKGNRSK